MVRYYRLRTKLRLGRRTETVTSQSPRAAVVPEDRGPRGTEVVEKAASVPENLGL